jgi:hypothetical protein
MANKFALLIGINYIDSQNQLSGCINDVIMVRKYLMEKKGYLDSNIVMMREDSNKFQMPNRANIITQLTELINKANQNNASEIFFHYSGHGTYGIDRNREEFDGRDEMICPVDLKMITDDELRAIISKLNNTTQMYAIMDSCHSGTNLDLPYVYNYINNRFVLIQNNAVRYREFANKNIFSISGCRDEQYSADAYQIYSSLSDVPEYSINSNRSGGALTFFLLNLLNEGVHFIDCLQPLQRNLANSKFDQVPLLSSSKLIVKRKITIDTKMKVIVNLGENKAVNNKQRPINKINKSGKILMVPVRNH